MGNLFKTNPGIQSSLQNMLQVCPLTYSNPLTEVGNNVFFHACWNGSDFIFKILLELGNLSRLVGRHFAVQVASQVEVWGAQVWGVGAPEGVKASADDAIAKVLLYPCQRGYRAIK